MKNFWVVIFLCCLGVVVGITGMSILVEEGIVDALSDAEWVPDLAVCAVWLRCSGVGVLVEDGVDYPGYFG
nr:MAG TPA: hypothetical protein [Crassvirales sp.]